MDAAKVLSLLGDIEKKNLEPSSIEYVNINRNFMEQGFKLISITEIKNSKTTKVFDFFKDPEFYGSYNIQSLYHCSSNPEDLIITEGLDLRYSKSSGFFGRGLYFTDRPQKANEYSPQKQKGDYENERTMFMFDVNLGNMFSFDEKKINRDLVKPPNGFSSVKGHINNGDEFVVYANEQVNIRYVIKYKLLNPPKIKPNITKELDTFIRNIYAKSFEYVKDDVSIMNKCIELIKSLLINIIKPEDFIKEIKELLKEHYENIPSKLSVEELYSNGKLCNPQLFIDNVSLLKSPRFLSITSFNRNPLVNLTVLQRQMDPTMCPSSSSSSSEHSLKRTVSCRFDDDGEPPLNTDKKIKLYRH